MHKSLLSLRYWLLPFFVYVALYDYDILPLIKKYIWIPSIFLFLDDIVLFIYWHSNGASPLIKTHLYQLGYYLMGDIFYKVYTSTVIICILIFIWFYIEKSIYKTSLIILNLISGILSYDRMFIISLLIVILSYIFLEKLKFSLKKMILFLFITSITISVITLFLILIGMDLHINDRLGIYSYWLPKVLVSPIIGVGVGKNCLQTFFLTHYPPSAQLLAEHSALQWTSHNFFLDLLLTQGIVGLVIYLLALYKITYTSFQYAIYNNIKYKFVTFYIIIGIFSKFLVDNSMDDRPILVFWFFIICSYLINKNKLNNG